MSQVENGSDPNAVAKDGTTPLRAAVSREHVPLAAALARRGGDLTVRDHQGRRPLDLLRREQEVEDISAGHCKAAERSLMLVRRCCWRWGWAYRSCGRGRVFEERRRFREYP